MAIGLDRGFYILFVYTAFVNICLHLCDSIEDSKLRGAAHCPGQVISRAHRYRTLGARSVLECAAACRPDARCLAIVFDANNLQCYLGNATSEEDCSNMEPAVGKLKFYETTQSCQHGGQLAADGSCSCVEGFIGTRCERRMGDCTEGRASGFFMNDGVYSIQPRLASAPFPVYCQMLAQTRTYLLVRGQRTFNFNRTWQEYRDGFGDPSGDYWLGLEKLHQLTISKAYELRFRVKLGTVKYYSMYRHFVVADEASGYPISLTSVLTSTLDDCLTALQGARFSAYDVDNDNSATTNCASVFGGGWWYSGDGCSVCNPTGPVLPPFDGGRRGVLGELFWNGLGDLSPFPIVVYLVVM